MSATICLLAILPGLGLYIQGGRGKASYKSDFFPNITTIWSLHGALRTIFVAYNFPFRNIRTQSSFISEMSCTKMLIFKCSYFFVVFEQVVMLPYFALLPWFQNHPCALAKIGKPSKKPCHPGPCRLCWMCQRNPRRCRDHKWSENIRTIVWGMLVCCNKGVQESFPTSLSGTASKRPLQFMVFR